MSQPVQPAEAPQDQSTRLVIGAVAVTLLLASLGQTIVSTALPTIVGQLGGLDHLTWVVIAYLLSSTVVAPIYGKRKVRAYLKKLRVLQNHLGDLNDAANVRSVVSGLLRDKSRKNEDVDMLYAAGAMVGWYGAQTPRAISSALKRYRKFKRVRPFWQ